jgi:preprotein translocase subunit SecG
MINTLLFVHLVIAILLIIVILLQRTSTDGISSIGGGNNMGLVGARSAANFLTKITIFLAIVFFVNALVLANLASRAICSLIQKIETQKQVTPTKQGSKPIKKEPTAASAIPIAK